MYRRLFPYFLLIVVVFTLLTSCSTMRPVEFEQISEELMIQIARDQDDYLSAMKDKNISELLTFHSITYGSFTESDSSEMLVLFKVKDVPHVGGLDRTIAAIYDANTYLLKSQKTFVADYVSLQLLTDKNQRKNILYIGSVTYQGYTAYSMELFEIEGDRWLSKAISSEAFMENDAYAYTNEILQVFDLSYSDHAPVYDYKYTLYWDSTEATFRREMP
ncbi:MAG: hypothetical protein WCX60_02255 [Anaerovoracaceae bacterium]